MNKLDETVEMFEVFARLHPIEAYDLDSEKFCDFMRDEGYPMTDEEIKELVNSTREELDEQT